MKTVFMFYRIATAQRGKQESIGWMSVDYVELKN